MLNTTFKLQWKLMTHGLNFPWKVFDPTKLDLHSSFFYARKPKLSLSELPLTRNQQTLKVSLILAYVLCVLLIAFEKYNKINPIICYCLLFSLRGHLPCSPGYFTFLFVSCYFYTFNFLNIVFLAHLFTSVRQKT